MYSCENHSNVVVVFDKGKCPLCDALEEIEDLKSDKIDLEGEIENLKEQVRNQNEYDDGK